MLQAWPPLLWWSHPCCDHHSPVTSITPLLQASHPCYEHDHSCAAWLHEIACVQCLSSYGFPSSNALYMCVCVLDFGSLRMKVLFFSSSPFLYCSEKTIDRHVHQFIPVWIEGSRQPIHYGASPLDNSFWFVIMPEICSFCLIVAYSFHSVWNICYCGYYSIIILEQWFVLIA